MDFVHAQPGVREPELRASMGPQSPDFDDIRMCSAPNAGRDTDVGGSAPVRRTGSRPPASALRPEPENGNTTEVRPLSAHVRLNVGLLNGPSGHGRRP